ncbi:MAG TPA: hypothetical protein PLG17_02745 [Thermodesulfobacteriota bacterium]|nr:hypothetical protein [Deltaproteobacteria bacterium]HNR13428.1 hypothetical protein [Thermodesulfobacteriota bacterium]HNU73012.1 hypothetical protein [Thermodesulfobacteriota bacterium]HOC38239.1 hypothetical protein [Thermodesulfobacteriota bacterium]HQO77412.1 hypothetical protein [Thermodesulfobacteriota bacterium]
MPANKVVVHYNDGTILKGTTTDFFPNRAQFRINISQGSAQTVYVEEIKAVFFVKDFDGNKQRQDVYESEIIGGGKKIRVEFGDGEVINGHTLGYSPDRIGFFVTPADPDSNNSRIFVIKSSTKSIKFI